MSDDPHVTVAEAVPASCGERERVRALVAHRLLGDDPTLDPAPPTIGRFALLRRIGAGGMGVVWAAYDEQLDRKVALKVIREDREELRARTLREAQALARLSHPNIVPIYEVGMHEGRLFLAMEFVDGITLRSFAGAPEHNLAERLAVYRQAALGLHAAHQAGIVHRDFKPDNAVVGADGRVRVLDFGLARDSGEPAATGGALDTVIPGAAEPAWQSPLTRTGALMGTPAYMAPEQIFGERADARADQFAFCVSLYEALYGERPFAGETREQLVANVSRGRLRPLPRAHAVPGWIHRVLLRGLAVDPGHRWPSMQALVRALDADPARRRRVLGGAAAAALLGVAVVAAVQHRRAAAQQACSDEAASILTTYDDGARARTGAAAGALDAYAQGWSDALQASCVAATIERTRTDALHQRARACLHERAAGFAALVAVLGDPSTPAAAREATVVAALPPTDPCAQTRWLARRPERPAEHEDAITSLQAELGEARALAAVGRFGEALDRLHAIEPGARAVAWAPLQLELSHVLAIARRGVGERDGARVALEAAFGLAGASDDLARAAALARELSTLPPADGDGGAAARWQRVAGALDQRIDGSS